MSPHEREAWRRQAVLYVADELSADEKALFEQRLGDSQEIRDLLVQAMEQLAQRWITCQPEPTWRQRLRQRLRRERVGAFGLLSFAASALVGAVTATLLVGLFLWWRAGSSQQAGPSVANNKTSEPHFANLAVAPAGLDDVEAAEDTAAVAYVDLTDTQRVTILRQWTTERQAHKSASASALHAPLVEYLSQPCPKRKHSGM
ncbi:hypothetical protein HRbin36_00155 [bacterium HR36]|nr:hypothetical protein HRbin36_00155 [bacterium HR36]